VVLAPESLKYLTKPLVKVFQLGDCLVRTDLVAKFVVAGEVGDGEIRERFLFDY
jgi:hypothetical protein